MSEVLKWFYDNIYYSVHSGNVTFSIQNEDLWEFEELLKKQDKELQQKDNIIKEARELLNQEWYSVLRKGTITKVKEILDKEQQDDKN